MNISPISISLRRALLGMALIVGGAAPATAGTTFANAYPASYYAPHSKLASGRWVKVKITTSGIHQITDQELRDMGFADPQRVAVYGLGGVRLANMEFPADLPDDQPAVPQMRYGDKIIFYGEADLATWAMVYNGTHGTNYRRNYFAPYGTYYLTDSQPAAALREASYVARLDSLGQLRQDSLLLRTARDVAHFEEELHRPNRYSARAFGQRFSEHPQQDVQLHMPSFDPQAGEVAVSFAAYGQTDNGQYNGLKWTMGRFHKTVRWQMPQYCDFKITQVDDNKIGLNALDVDPTGNDLYTINFDSSVGTSREIALDFVAANYPRSTSLRNLSQPQRLIFPSVDFDQNILFTDVDPAVSDLQIWDISKPYAPVNLEVAPGPQADQRVVSAPNSAYMNSEKGGLLLMAFDPAATLPSVEMMEEIENQDLHAITTDPDLVIVTTDRCESQAERLADIHRRLLGHQVVVVNSRKVYNEFSTGAPSIAAVRRFVRMFLDRSTSGKTPALLLFGGATSDNRCIETPSLDFPASYLPIFEIEEPAGAGFITKSYVSDAFYGMLSKSFQYSYGNAMLKQQMVIPVGRIPATEGGDAQNAVDKIEHFLTHDQSAGRSRAIIVSDNGNKNGHTLQADEIHQIIAECDSTVNVNHSYSALQPKGDKFMPDHVMDLLKKGAMYFTFMGHGRATDFGASPQILTSSMVNNNPYPILPLVSVASCWTQDIDLYCSSALGANMVLCPKGGAIGVIGSSREVFMGLNHTFNKEVARAIYSAKTPLTTGEAYRVAHNTTVTSIYSASDLLYNTFCYNLEGDPALPLTHVAENAALTTINGNPLPQWGQTVPLEVGDTLVLHGQIGTLAGAVGPGQPRQTLTLDSTFNGKISLRLFAAPDTLRTVKEGADDMGYIPPQLDLELDDAQAVTYIGSVKDGEFTVSGIVPPVNRYGAYNTLQIIAQEPDGGRMATGIFRQLQLVAPAADFQQDISEFPAPEITQMYLNSPEFRSGDVVDGSGSIFYAEVETGAYGLSVDDQVASRQPRLAIDGTNTALSEGYFTYGADGHMEIRYDMADLPDGQHTLELRIFNGAGVPTTRSITFWVINTGNDPQLAVEESPVKDAATFTLTGLDSNIANPTARLIIYNAAGKAVDQQPDVTFPYRWQRPSNLPAGSYSARAYITANRNHQTSTRIIFPIL